MKKLFKLLDGLNCLAHQAGVPADAGAGGTEPHASTPSVLDGAAAPAQSSATPHNRPQTLPFWTPRANRVQQGRRTINPPEKT